VAAVSGRRAICIPDFLEALGFEGLADDIRITRSLWVSRFDDAVAAVAGEVLRDATRLREATEPPWSKRQLD